MRGSPYSVRRMAVGIIMPLFALGASALGVTAEFAKEGCFLKGILGLAGGVGTNGLFDWLKSRWFTRAPGAAELLENHHLAQITGTALRRGFELAAAEAEILDPDKRSLALHSPRLRKLAATADERWQTLVDDEKTPQLDALRSAQLTELVTAVCRNQGAAPVLEAADWEPLVRGVDLLEGGKSLSPAAVSHAARVLRDRVARLFYELVKDARETSPEAYAALQLHFFADLKSAAAAQSDELRAIRTEIETLTATLADGAGEQVRKVKFNWARLTSLLRPMRDMAEEWRAFYTRHDQRWDVLLARLDAMPEETAKRVWERAPAWLRFALPILVAALAGAGIAAWNMGHKLDEQNAKQTRTADEIRELRGTIAKLSGVAEQILGTRGMPGGGGSNQRPGAILADIATERGQKPDELRTQLAETAAKAALLAAEAKGAEALKLWREAGSLAAAAGEYVEAEKFLRAALALADGATWCDVAQELAYTLQEQSRLGEQATLLADVVKRREALGDVWGVVDSLGELRIALESHGRYVDAEDAAGRIIALEPKFPVDPEKRGDCIGALIAARMNSGSYQEILRLCREYNSLPYGPSPEGRLRARFATYQSGTQMLVFGDTEGGLAAVERAVAMEPGTELAQRVFIGQAVGTLTRVFRMKPKPPRVRALIDVLMKQADELVARDFARFGALLHAKAAVLASDDRFDEEQAVMRDGLARARKHFSPGHVEIALWQSDLARLLGAPDEEAETEALWAEALPVMEKTLGPRHYLTLGVKSERARFFGYTRRIAKAEEESRAVLASLAELLPPGHPRVMTAKLDLLAALGAPERAAQARELREEIFITLRDHERPELPDVQPLFLRYLDMTTTDAERARFATEFERVVAKADARLDSANHWRTLMLSNLLSALEAAGQSTRAQAVIPRIVASSAKTFGESSTLHAKMLGAMCDEQLRHGDARAAEELARSAVAISEESGSTVEAAKSLKGLARLLQRTKREDEARASFERAWQFVEQRPDDDPGFYFDAMGEYGASLIGKDNAAAERLLRRSMDEEEKRYGYNPLAMEQRAERLGWLLQKGGRTKDAEETILRAIRQPRSFPDGTAALRIGTAFFTYTDLLTETGRAKEAEVRLRRALSMTSSWQQRAEDCYFRALRALGWQDSAIGERLERIVGGGQVPEL